MSQPGGVRGSTVALCAVVAAVASWIGLTWWRGTGGQAPPLPWLALLPLAMVSVAVLAAGWRVRRYLQTAGTPHQRPLTPQQARGTLVAAQAAALAGALLVGWYLANAGLHLPNADVPSVRDQVFRAGTNGLAAAALCVSGLVAQAMCRLPPEDDDEAGERELGPYSPASG